MGPLMRAVAESRRAWLLGGALLASCGGEPPVVEAPATPSLPPPVEATPAPAPSAEAEPAPPPRVDCPEGMARLSGGEYARRLWRDSVEPTTVEVGAFCMDRTEVTVSAYGACVDAGVCTTPHDSEWIGFEPIEPKPTRLCNGLRPDRGNHPVNCVDFKQAKDYCAWRGLRLPDLDEWHWAARSGPEGRRYPWGSIRLLRQACSSRYVDRERTGAGTCEVGAHPLGDSAQGIHDLAGNVSEWTTTENPRSRWGHVTLAFVGGGYNMRNEGMLVLHQYLSERARQPYVGVRCVKPLRPAPAVPAPPSTVATCPGNAAACKLGCDRGDLASCTHLGEHHQAGAGVHRDRPKAAALYRKACDRDHAKGCTRLAFLHDRGMGVAKDFKRAAGLYQQACRLGDPEGCIEVGLYFKLGQGRARDSARAAGWFARACQLGSAEGCRRQAGGDANLKRRRTLLEKACKGGDGIGCNMLGEMHARGRGVPKDATRAAALYGRGCELRYSPACTALGEATLRGEGVPQDRTRGIQLIRQGCRAGHTHACSRAEQLDAKP